MNRLRTVARYALRTLLLLSPTFGAGGCTEPTKPPPDGDDEIQVSRQSVTAVQGDVFVIEATLIALGEPTSAARLAIDLPDHVELIGAPEVVGSQGETLRFHLRGLIPGTDAATVRHTTSDGFEPRSILIEIVPGAVEVVESPGQFMDEGEEVALVLRDETLTFGAAFVGPDGCPVPGAADLLELDVTGTDTGLEFGPYVPGPVSLPGCPEAADAGLFVPVTGLRPGGPAVLDYGVVGADALDRLVLRSIERAFDPVQADGGLSFAWTVRSNNTGTCAPTDPVTVDFTGTLIHDAVNGTRLLPSGGGAYQGSVDADGLWTFTSDEAAFEGGVTGVEIWEPAPLVLSRTPESGLEVLHANRSIRIEFMQNGQLLCTSRAEQDAVVTVPWSAFDYLTWGS